jgi:response regulator RpfG family c-di-GMP phosphodiesterase
MEEKILFVDDDENLLAGIRRQLRKLPNLDSAVGGEAALESVKTKGPYAVVISDMRMPGMDGVQLLARIRECSPETIRIMLTGNHDIQTAVQAVNEGNIFRFLTKPCEARQLETAIEAGVRQYRLVLAERELLDKTLGGVIRLLTEMLSLTDAQLFGRTERVREYARTLGEFVGSENLWEMDVAAMLCPLGFVSIPPGLMIRHRSGLTMMANERQMIEKVPAVGSTLLEKIPRLESVARIVLYQNKNYDGTGFPADDVKGNAIPLASRIIRVVTDFAGMERDGTSRVRILALLKKRQGAYDPDILAEAASCFVDPEFADGRDHRRAPIQCQVRELRPGDVLISDLLTKEGSILLSAGTKLSGPALARARNIAEYSGIREPVSVQSHAGEIE